MEQSTGPDDPYLTKDYWTKEFQASKKAMEKFHEKGKKVIDRFLDKRESRKDIVSSLNLFHSNTVTVRALMFGQTPTVEVDRRFQDSEDDEARVATLILERMLNTDIQAGNDRFSDSIRNALDDYLLPGLGCARVRYEYTAEKIEVEVIGADGVAVMAEEEKLLDENIPTEYVHWKDVLWSAGARTWKEVRWIAFRTYLTKEEVEDEFGEEIAEKLTFAQQKIDKSRSNDKTAVELAEIWEIWCKDYKTLHWYSDSCDELLRNGPDPLQLEDFFPCPQPLMANLTTDLLMPLSEYHYAQDLYNEIDLLSARISILTKAVKAVGVYDKASDGVKRMLQEGVDNELIPVDNWAMFAEKGGLKGQVDWLPIEAVVNALTKLRELREDAINLLYQTTGLSDIMRGQAAATGTSATEQSLKARFASVRIQVMQDLFAMFATELQRLKAQIISKHFSPETIAKRSNIMKTPDAALAPAAIALLKNPKEAIWRIQVRPESVAMVDYAQLKQDRMEFINSLSMFMQSAAPLAQLDPGVTPYLIELLKWGMAGFKGSQQIEGTLDKAVAAAMQGIEAKKNQPPEPSPEQIKAQAAQQKTQMDMQKSQQEAQADMMKTQMTFQQSMAELAAKSKADMSRIFAELQADIQREAAQAKFSIMEKMLEPPKEKASAS